MLNGVELKDGGEASCVEELYNQADRLLDLTLLCGLCCSAIPFWLLLLKVWLGLVAASNCNDVNKRQAGCRSSH